MSLDLWLRSLECQTCKHSEITESFNYTYNVSKMWHLIYPNQNKMIDIDELTGHESLPLLKCALQFLKEFPDKFISMNPENGWGSYETFKSYIKNLIDLAEKHPTWVWESCR